MKRLSSLTMALLPAVAFAQSNKIETSLTQRALPWAAGIAVAIGALGLVRAGIKFSSGDPDAKDSAKGAVIGSVIALSAGTLISLLRTWFG